MEIKILVTLRHGMFQSNFGADINGLGIVSITTNRGSKLWDFICQHRGVASSIFVGSCDPLHI